MNLPAVIAHADWSTRANKRWVAVARRSASGDWQASASELVGDPGTLVDRLTATAHCDGPLFAGFDFPIGVPIRYATLAGVDNFRMMISELGHNEWSQFYQPARDIGEVCVRRPFFPGGLVKKGEVDRQKYASAIGVEQYSDLLRECERKTPTRGEASSLFWTLGGKQVGKAAIAGWQQLLGPLLSRRSDVGVWPFDGSLAQLFSDSAVVLAETYPGEFYGHLGVDPRRKARGHTKRGKTVQRSRRLNAEVLLHQAELLRVQFSSEAIAEIRDGFGAGKDGEDRFDAVVGLLGMINVAVGNRPEGGAESRERERIEGWILGQTRSNRREALHPEKADAEQ